MLYPQEVIYISPGLSIHLNFVESFAFAADNSEDANVDKLKDDFCFNIVMTSGKEYTVSSKYIQDYLGWTAMTPKLIAQGIHSKWVYIHKYQERR